VSTLAAEGAAAAAEAVAAEPAGFFFAEELGDAAGVLKLRIGPDGLDSESRLDS
jgi:hypothetical protein